MSYGKIKRKIIKAGVELRVQSNLGTGYEFIGYFANRLQAQVFAQKYHSGKNFRVTNVRVDVTPLSSTGKERG